VLSVDPDALASLLRFTGPIAVAGVPRPFTADNTARYLLRDQYLQFGDGDQTDRIDALEAVAELTFERLTSANLPGPRALARSLGPIVERGHLQLVSFDDDAATFLRDVGIDGALPPVDGDFLAVTTSNATASKIDLFLARAVDYDVRWQPRTGHVEATVTIRMANGAPAGGLPDYVIGNEVGRQSLDGRDLPDGYSRSFVTLYTPWRPTAATLDGEPLDLEVLTEVGRNALSTFVSTPPGGASTLVVRLVGRVDDPRRYRLEMAAQPLVRAERVTVRVRPDGADLDAATGPVEAVDGEVRGAFDLVRNTEIAVERG
jgi:hypothetical protein